jgi:Chalcone isomerase-like
LIFLLRSGLVLLATLCSVASAVQVVGENLPDEWKLADQTLVLNGAGVREYGFLRIPVYVAALYVAKRETQALKLLDGTFPLVIHLKMLRDVNRDDSVKAWRLYLNANCQPPCQLNPQALASFTVLIPESSAKDTQTYVFSDGSLTLYKNTVKLGTVLDKTLASSILASWLGSAPTTEGLKRSLLGL